MAMALATSCGTTHAADCYWTGTFNNLWPNPGNWSAMPGSADRAVFSSAASRFSVNLDTFPPTIDSVKFESSTQYVISNGSLLFGDLTCASDGAFLTHLIAANVEVRPDSIWTIAEGMTVEVIGEFDTSGDDFYVDPLQKMGDGTLIIAGNNNSVGGDLAVQNGEVVLGGGSAYSDTDAIGVELAGTLRLLNNETIGALWGDATGTVELESNRLTLAGADFDATYRGTITGDETSTIQIQGSQSHTLTGSATVGGFDSYGGRFVLDGATLTMPADGLQEMTISGVGTAVEVRGGATVQMPSTGTGGVYEGSCWIVNGAEMLITGSGSHALASRLDLGGSGSPCTLTVSNGGLLDVTLGSEPWLVVGGNTTASADGALLIESGGDVVADAIVAGLSANNFGTITVQGTGSTLGISRLFLGGYHSGQYGGTGGLSITDGGSVSASDGIDVFMDSSSISVNGGVLTTPRLTVYLDANPLVEISDSANGSALVLTDDPGTSTIDFQIIDAAGGPGSIEKIGTGMLELAHDANYSGGLTVTDGSLRLKDAARQFASLTGTGPVMFEGVRLDGTGVIGGSLTVQSGGVLEDAVVEPCGGSDVLGTESASRKGPVASERRPIHGQTGLTAGRNAAAIARQSLIVVEVTVADVELAEDAADRAPVVGHGDVLVKLRPVNQGRSRGILSEHGTAPFSDVLCESCVRNREFTRIRTGDGPAIGRGGIARECRVAADRERGSIGTRDGAAIPLSRVAVKVNVCDRTGSPRAQTERTALSASVIATKGRGTDFDRAVVGEDGTTTPVGGAVEKVRVRDDDPGLFDRHQSTAAPILRFCCIEAHLVQGHARGTGVDRPAVPGCTAVREGRVADGQQAGTSNSDLAAVLFRMTSGKGGVGDGDIALTGDEHGSAKFLRHMACCETAIRDGRVTSVEVDGAAIIRRIRLESTGVHVHDRVHERCRATIRAGRIGFELAVNHLDSAVLTVDGGAPDGMEQVDEAEALDPGCASRNAGAVDDEPGPSRTAVDGRETPSIGGANGDIVAGEQETGVARALIDAISDDDRVTR